MPTDMPTDIPTNIGPDDFLVADLYKKKKWYQFWKKKRHFFTKSTGDKEWRQVK